MGASKADKRPRNRGLDRRHAVSKTSRDRKNKLSKKPVSSHPESDSPSAKLVTDSDVRDYERPRHSRKAIVSINGVDVGHRAE